MGHDVLDISDIGTDPGDRELLSRAAAEDRILITIDTDFGELIFLHDMPHAGLIRLPDVPMEQRIDLMSELIRFHRAALDSSAIVTIRGGRIRLSSPLASRNSNDLR